MKKRRLGIIVLIFCFFLTGFFACKSEAEKKAEAKAYLDSGLAKNDDYKGEIEDYTKAIELDPDYQMAYHNRGNAKRMLGDYAGAIKDFNKVLELGRKYGGVYYLRGLSKYGLGDKQGALEDLNKAEKLGVSEASGRIKEIKSK